MAWMGGDLASQREPRDVPRTPSKRRRLRRAQTLRCLWNRTRWQSLAEEEKVTGHASVQVGTRRGVTFGHVEYHEFTTEETKEEGKEAHANLEPFYRSLSEVLGEDVHSNWENHLAVQHFKGDGPVGFNALLFVPRREPCDLFEPKMVRNNFGLFLRRTFALVNSDALVPEWLNLVTGVVEPQKGQLALSQDELQRRYMFRKIKKLVVKKRLEMFAEIVQKKGYPQKFYVEFGRHLKLGPYGDSHLGRMAAELLQPPAAAAAVHPPGTQHDAYAKEAALHSSCTVASSVPVPDGSSSGGSGRHSDGSPWPSQSQSHLRFRSAKIFPALNV